MKTCSYCGQGNDEAAALCTQCGTSLAVGPAKRPEASGSPEVAPHVPSKAVGGVAVVLICTGMAVLSRSLIPGIYAVSSLRIIWIVVLGFVALALTLSAGSICCRTPLNRVVFTLVVLAVLVFEGVVWLPDKTDLISRGPWAVVRGGIGLLMILIGAFALARFLLGIIHEWTQQGLQH